MSATEVPPGLPAAGGRGALRIADRVLVKIAGQAAREVLRDAVGAHLVPADRAPRASVSVRRGSVRVQLSVELGYPVAIGTVCGEVGRHVDSRIRELTGMEVSRVSVDVERLHTAAGREAGKGRTR